MPENAWKNQEGTKESILNYLLKTIYMLFLERARLFRQAKPGLWTGSCSKGGHQETRGQGFKMKSSVETIRKCGQVARSVFVEVKGMVGPGEAGLEIAQDGVDPKEIRQLSGLSARGHGGLVTTVRLGHSCEAGEPVGKHGATQAELGFGPVCDRLARKAGDHRQLEVQRMSTIVERDRRDKGHLVFRTPTDLAACAFSPQIGVVNLDLTLERVECFALGHGLHELVMHPPGGGVADPQGPLQSQRGQACFRKFKSLPYSESRLKPGMTMAQLEKIALSKTDNEAAEQMNIARDSLFQSWTERPEKRA